MRLRFVIRRTSSFVGRTFGPTRAHTRGRTVRLALAALACLFAPRIAPAQRSVADSIRMLDSAWARAYATNDTTFADRLFSDSMLATSSGGVVKNKPGEMADVRPQSGLKMHYFRTGDVAVQVYADAAVAAGLAEWQFTWNGQQTTLRRRYTSTYVRGGPLGWRMVALHIGPAASR